MCNDAIRIAVKQKPTSRFKLIELAYPRLKDYGLHTHYILSACEVAHSVFKNRTRKAAPYIKRHFIKLGSQSYTLDHLIVRIPTRPRRFIYLTLHASNYHLSFLDDPALKRGSITLTDSGLALALSKEITEIEPRGRIGIDVNERNVTWADSSGVVVKEDTSRIAELKERHKAIRAKIAQRTSKDRRIQKRLLADIGSARGTGQPRLSIASRRGLSNTRRRTTRRLSWRTSRESGGYIERGTAKGSRSAEE
ncbi:MAG TPA: hypothetical protein VEO75_01870 [Nitrososphaerales archaeon]|nr:hypothetical protein [Nitrososphaerales archaeon]